jgi:hypothetical protein
MNELARRLRQLLVGHGCVTGTEIDRALGDLPYASTRPNRLIIDLHTRLVPLILGHPLRVEGIGKSRTGTTERERAVPATPSLAAPDDQRENEEKHYPDMPQHD